MLWRDLLREWVLLQSQASPLFMVFLCTIPLRVYLCLEPVVVFHLRSQGRVSPPLVHPIVKLHSPSINPTQAAMFFNCKHHSIAPEFYSQAASRVSSQRFRDMRCVCEGEAWAGPWTYRTVYSESASSAEEARQTRDTPLDEEARACVSRILHDP